mmetsp:Transcript_45222/g.40501  ORF Transcript_45222/g.40501 Transcript_45222/m.40501 type:complete len:155 (+) Transcript_45222:179-643(+)
MNSLKLSLLLLSLLIFIVFGDRPITNNYDYDPKDMDHAPSSNGEKALPNEHVYDSHEPNDPNNTPDWKYTINRVVSISAIVQVVILICYIIVSRACCIRIIPPRYGADGYPLKPWHNNERIYDQSERKYLSKDDAVPSDGDFDTDPEDLEIYNN